MLLHLHCICGVLHLHLQCIAFPSAVAFAVPFAFTLPCIACASALTFAVPLYCLVWPWLASLCFGLPCIDLPLGWNPSLHSHLFCLAFTSHLPLHFPHCIALPCLAFGFAFELAFAWHCLTPPLHLNLHRLHCLALPCLALPCFAPPHPQFLCRCLVAFPMHMHEFAQDRLRASWLCPELLPGHRKNTILLPGPPCFAPPSISLSLPCCFSHRHA